MLFLDRRPFPTLICGVVATVMCVLLSAGCAERRSEQYRQQGDSYFHIQKYQEAEASYRSAVQADPSNSEAKLGLGRCLTAMGKPEEALACFQGLMTSAPQIDLGYLEAAMLLLGLGNYDAASEAAANLEKVDAEKGGLLRAALMLRSGRQTEAMGSLSTLQGRFPDSFLVQTHHACALLETGEPAQAETELKPLLEKPGSDSTGAAMLMVDALAAQGRAAEMIERLEKLTTKEPGQNAVLARALIRGGRAVDGETLASDLLTADPTSAWGCFVMGSYLLEKAQRNEAVPFLRKACVRLPWEAIVMRDLALAQKPAAAPSPTPPGNAKTTSATEKGVPSAAAAATSEDWRSLWRQAALRRLLEERARFAGSTDPSLRETLVLAALFRGNGALAEELAKDLPADSPLNAYLNALSERDPQKAVNALEPWGGQEGDLKLLAQNAAGYAMGLYGARGQAVQVLSACWERYPDNGVSMLLLAQVFRVAQMPQFAARALEKLTAAFPENIEAHIIRFGILREGGMQREARQAAELAYALFPESPEVNQALCGIYVDAKELDLAQRVAERYLQTHGNDTEMQLTRASILLRQGKIDEAAKALVAIPASDKTAAGIEVFNVLTSAMSQEWQKIIDMPLPAEPQSVALPVRFILAAAHVKTGQKDKAMSVLSQPGKEEPFGGRAGAIVLKALGQPSGAPLADETSLSADETALSDALSSSADMLADFSCGIAYQMSRLDDDAYLAFKRVDDALSADNDSLLRFLFASLPNVVRLKEAGQEAKSLAEKHSTRPKAWQECAAVLQRLGDTTGERAALDKAAEVGPDLPEVFLQRGDFFARQKDMAGAIAEYRRLLQLRPDDPIGNNNLAYYLLMTGGDTAEALKAGDLALKGRPRDPHVLHTLGVAQLRAGQLEQSKTNLSAALQLMPGDPSLLLDYGQLMLALGNAEEGRRHIETALNYTKALGLDFDRKSEAEEILARNSSGSARTPAPPMAPGQT